LQTLAIYLNIYQVNLNYIEMIKGFDNDIKDKNFIIRIDISKDILSLIIRIILFCIMIIIKK